MTTEQNETENATNGPNGQTAEPAPATVTVVAEAGDQTPPEALVVAALTPEQIEELQAQAAKAAESWDRYVRAVSDLDNYKKRAARERQEATRFANESLLAKLVPVLDNFEMALAATNSTSGATVESLRTGVTMIGNQLKAALAEAGLEEVDATGAVFNPAWHEAVAHQESADLPEGQVLQQLRKGYRFRERLLRPATVIVAKKTGAA